MDREEIQNGSNYTLAIKLQMAAFNLGLDWRSQNDAESAQRVREYTHQIQIIMGEFQAREVDSREKHRRP